MRTKCQVARAAEIAEESLHEMPYAAQRFEAQGWALSLELAPRCEWSGCWVCNG